MSEFDQRHTPEERLVKTMALTGLQARLFQLVSEHHFLNTATLAKMVKTSHATVQTQMRNLTKEGLVESVALRKGEAPSNWRPCPVRDHERDDPGIQPVSSDPLDRLSVADLRAAAKDSGHPLHARAKSALAVLIKDPYVDTGDAVVEEDESDQGSADEEADEGQADEEQEEDAA